MAPAGTKMVQLAKNSGTWNALNDVDNLVIPPALAAAFTQAGRAARENRDGFPSSVRRGILEWIFTAKRAATRENRILKTAALAQRNERANQYRK